jgi:glycosyltransferase involved in cell wall biosynthesis
LEALGSGLPVVTTRVGEVALVVKNSFCGRIVDGFDAGDLATALKQVTVSGSELAAGERVKAVADYHPKRVLAPLYERMSMLHEQKCSS